MSEVIPEDEDRGGDGAMEGATGGGESGESPGSGFGLEGDPDVEDIGGVGDEPGADL